MSARADLEGGGNIHSREFATLARQSGPEVDARFDYDIAVVGLGYERRTALAHPADDLRVLVVNDSPDRTSEPFTLSQARAVMVGVPTPVDGHFVLDLDALRDMCTTVVEHAVAGQMLILTSTTYVGCTEDLLVKPLARRGFRIGVDIFVAFSADPIEARSESASRELWTRVVGGATPKCLDRAVEVLVLCGTPVSRSPTLAFAETAKLLENTFRAVNVCPPGVQLRDRHAHDRPL